jgi:two-component system cell cycle sensor histidine kinase/response regulator CckA
LRPPGFILGASVKKDREEPPPTILLADDHADVREVARRILAEKGYRVLDAASAARAIEIAAQPGAIQLALLEVDLPDMSGVELADRLRQEQPGSKVIFMSGYPEALGVFNGPVLAKPFPAAELLRVMREELWDPEGDPDAA